MFNPTSPIYSLDAFLFTFGVEAQYTAPDGTIKNVRVIFNSRYAPVVTATGAITTLQNPQATGRVKDFLDVKESGTPTLKIGLITYYVIDVEETATGEITLTLSENSR